MIAVHEELIRLLARGERVVVATIIRGRGSHPREAGAKMLVTEGGRSHFSIGGGALEATVIADCGRAFLEPGPAVRTYDLAETGERAVGMTCGGTVDVLLELMEPPPRLVIFGGGHVGRALAQAARTAGLPVLVVDDRAEWLVPDDFPPGTALHRCARDYASDLPPVAPSACVAVMTRCHATDIAVLASLASVRPRYVGLIGSRRKVRRAFDALVKDGVPQEWLDTLRAPIGLDIGAETAGEIAIAVAAEVIGALRRPAQVESGAAARVESGAAARAESGAAARAESGAAAREGARAGRGARPR